MFGGNSDNNQTNNFSNVNLPNNGVGPAKAYGDPNPPPGAPIDPLAALANNPANPSNSFDPAFANSPPPQAGPPAGPPAGGPGGDLIDIKRQALSQLSPLVGQLDQTPEEKFRTTMMMIQASDNQYLIKDAYNAAQAIPDTKARAQALLDVINEINYFSQKNQGQ